MTSSFELVDQSVVFTLAFRTRPLSSIHIIPSRHNVNAGPLEGGIILSGKRNRKSVDYSEDKENVENESDLLEYDVGMQEKSGLSKNEKDDEESEEEEMEVDSEAMESLIKKEKSLRAILKKKIKALVDSEPNVAVEKHFPRKVLIKVQKGQKAGDTLVFRYVLFHVFAAYSSSKNSLLNGSFSKLLLRRNPWKPTSYMKIVIPKGFHPGAALAVHIPCKQDRVVELGIAIPKPIQASIEQYDATLYALDHVGAPGVCMRRAKATCFVFLYELLTFLIPHFLLGFSKYSSSKQRHSTIASYFPWPKMDSYYFSRMVAQLRQNAKQYETSNMKQDRFCA